MTNRLRTQTEDDEEEVIPNGRPSKEIPDNFLQQFLNNRVFNSEAATSALPFILFLALLGMLYIANMNVAEKNIRDIDKISKEDKELSSDYKETKARFAYKSTLYEVAKRADSLKLGLKISVQPPQKLLA
ncbi:MAG: FtsL-like putative cell division protein, partial [Candidatus Saccharimonadales bacterium]